MVGEVRIEKSILEIIEAGRTEGNVYYLPDRQLDRSVYLAVNKALTLLGGKWNRKEKGHVFQSDISEAIDDLLLTGRVMDVKKQFQFFETPPPIASMLVEWAGVLPGHKCLEPSAGRGNIANAIRAFSTSSLDCVDLVAENVTHLEGLGFWAQRCDFLEWESDDGLYDRIVMNPPFARQQDIDHVERALTHLKPGGVLVSVMSQGIMFRSNKKTKDFWDLLSAYNWESQDLPHGAFKASGTMVSAIMLKIMS